MTTIDTDAYAPETIFARLLGGQSRVLLLAALLAEPSDWMTKTDIAERAGVSTRTVTRHIDLLVELGVVETKPSERGYTVYSLNKDSEVAKRLAQVEWAAINAEAARLAADME